LIIVLQVFACPARTLLLNPASGNVPRRGKKSYVKQLPCHKACEAGPAILVCDYCFTT
jgi:hypothetical protein